MFCAAGPLVAGDVGSGVADMIKRAVHEPDDVTAASVMDSMAEITVSLDEARKVLSDFRGRDWLPGSYTRTAHLEGRSQPYILYIPENYDPEKPCSLLIALHGAGDVGHSFWNRWRDTADEKNFVIAAPTSNPAGRWWSISSDAVNIVICDALLSIAIDPNRVFLTGFSNGGHGAWATGLRETWRFAGVIPMAGHPTNEMLAQDNDFLTNAHATPFYIWHGEKDQVITIRRTREAVKIMKERGYPVTYVEAEGRGHQQALTDFPPIGEWMEKQTRVPFPKKLDFYCDRIERGRCHWIRLDEIDGKAHVVALRDKDSIVIKTENVKKFSLLLSEKEFDLDKLTVKANGKEVKFRKPQGEVRTLLESVRLYGGLPTAYSAVVTIETKSAVEVEDFKPAPEIESGSQAEQVVPLLVSPDPAIRARALVSLQRVFRSNVARTDPSFRDLGIYIASVMTGDPDPVVRSRALMYVSFLGEDGAKKKVTEMMKDKSALVRADVAARIPRMMGDKATSMLRVLGTDEDAIVRMAALAGIPATRSEAKDAAPDAILDWVSGALADSDWRVRGAAIDIVPALKLKSKKSYAILGPFLSGGDRYLKCRAVLAAGSSCPEEAAKEITAAKSSDDKLLAVMGKQADRYAKLVKAGIDPTDYDRLRIEANQAITSGQNEKSIELYTRVLKINPNDDVSHYNLSCAYARLKKIDKALEHLAASILNGYREYEHMKQDPDMDNLRDTDEYKSWVEEEELPNPSAAPPDSIPEDMRTKKEAPKKAEPKKETPEEQPKEQPKEEPKEEPREEPKEDDDWR
jgi:predicted esterase